jgi:hypothetical protein
VTRFEPFLQGDAANFRANTMPELGLTKQQNDRNFFVSQLLLRPSDSFLLVLRDPPSLFSARIGSGNFVDALLTVMSDAPNVAAIQFKQFATFDQIYEITAGRNRGTALIQATQGSGRVLASLRIRVEPRPVVVEPKSPHVDVDVSAAIKEFFAGLKEGLAPHVSANAQAIKEKLILATLVPGSEVVLAAKFNQGIYTGLQEGLDSFLKMLKGVKDFAFDAKFRDEVLKAVDEFADKAVNVAMVWGDVMAAVRANPNKFVGPVMVNARSIGREIGNELGTQVTAPIAAKSATDLCEWAGRIVGLVSFEIVLAILTELVGIGAVQGARWIGESSAAVTRLLPRLKPLIASLEELKALLRARLGRTAESLEEAGAMAGRKSARGLSKIAKGAEAVPRKFTATETKALAEKITARMQRLGIPKENIGIPGFPNESGESFTAWGRTRGANVRGKGISVHGSVESNWPGFDAWNAASADDRIDAVIAHEWMEFNDLSHFETLELAEETKLPISQAAKDLLKEMKAAGPGWQHLVDERLKIP